jgi:hypothetical protein
LKTEEDVNKSSKYTFKFDAAENNNLALDISVFSAQSLFEEWQKHANLGKN